LAAAGGVLRYSGVDWALGPHRFMSLLAACVAFLLMLTALRWPEAPLAKRATAVGRFVVLVGGFGVAVSQWAPAVGAGGARGECHGYRLDHAGAPLSPGVLGSAALLGSFAVAALAPNDTVLAGLFNKTQALHYLLALAVVALGAAAGAIRRA
jgi:hypothetical protein